MTESSENLRITIGELEPRPESRERQLEQILRRAGSAAGQPCEADCDCQIGLRCLDGSCVEA